MFPSLKPSSAFPKKLNKTMLLTSYRFIIPKSPTVSEKMLQCAGGCVVHVYMGSCGCGYGYRYGCVYACIYTPRYIFPLAFILPKCISFFLLMYVCMYVYMCICMYVYLQRAGRECFIHLLLSERETKKQKSNWFHSFVWGRS